MYILIYLLCNDWNLGELIILGIFDDNPIVIYVDKKILWPCHGHHDGMTRWPDEGSVLFGSAGGVAQKGAGKTGVLHAWTSNFAYAIILRWLSPFWDKTVGVNRKISSTKKCWRQPTVEKHPEISRCDPFGCFILGSSLRFCMALLGMCLEFWNWRTVALSATVFLK